MDPCKETALARTHEEGRVEVCQVVPFGFSCIRLYCWDCHWIGPLVYQEIIFLSRRDRELRKERITRFPVSLCAYLCLLSFNRL